MERDLGDRSYSGAELPATLTITALEELSHMVLCARFTGDTVGILGTARGTHWTIRPTHGFKEIAALIIRPPNDVLPTKLDTNVSVLVSLVLIMAKE